MMPAAVAESNPSRAISATKSSETESIHSAIVATARAICPRKTWAYVAKLIHASPSVAKHRVAGTREFNAEEIALLLRSEAGFDVLKAMMGDVQPAWWRALKVQRRLAELRRDQEIQRRLLERLEREAAE